MRSRKCLLVMLAMIGLLASRPGFQQPTSLQFAGQAYAQQNPTDDKPAVSTPRVRIAQLKTELQEMERNGLFLGVSQPGLATAKPSENELDVLRELVETRLTRWRKIKTLINLDQWGWGKDTEPMARRDLQLALAELAWAEKHDNEALKYLRRAAAAAEQFARAAQADYDVGVTTLDVLLAAQQAKADVQLILLHAGGSLLNPKPKRTAPWAVPSGPLPDDFPAGERR
jgi:hypothetical protein